MNTMTLSTRPLPVTGNSMIPLTESQLTHVSGGNLRKELLEYGRNGSLNGSMLGSIGTFAIRGSVIGATRAGFYGGAIGFAFGIGYGYGTYLYNNRSSGGSSRNRRRFRRPRPAIKH
jgi:hypothetical protein